MKILLKIVAGIIALVGVSGGAYWFFWDGHQTDLVEVTVGFTPRVQKFIDTLTPPGIYHGVEVVNSTAEKEVNPSDLPEDSTRDIFDKFYDEIYPLDVIVKNNSRRVVLKSEFQISVFQKGHSTDLSKGKPVSSDKILKPGMSDTIACEIPSDSLYGKVKDYEYRIKYKWIRFE